MGQPLGTRNSSRTSSLRVTLLGPKVQRNEMGTSLVHVITLHTSLGRQRNDRLDQKHLPSWSTMHLYPIAVTSKILTPFAIFAYLPAGSPKIGATFESRNSLQSSRFQSLSPTSVGFTDATLSRPNWKYLPSCRWRGWRMRSSGSHQGMRKSMQIELEKN